MGGKNCAHGWFLLRASILTALGRMDELYFAQERLMNDRCRYCRKNFQTSPSRPQQAVGSQLSVSDNVGPNHRQKMASDPFYQPACLESPRNWRAAHPVRFTGSNIARTIPSTERNRQQHLRDQGESCKQQLGFRPKAFRETMEQLRPSRNACFRYRPLPSRNLTCCCY